MEQNKKNKGGRPRKKVLRNQQLAVMCNIVERKILSAKARQVNLTISEYLRDVGMNGKVVVKSLPREVVIAFNRLNNMSANLNQLTKKVNSQNAFEFNDYIELKSCIDEIQDFIKDVRNKLS